MTNQPKSQLPAEADVQTSATVAPTLGFPNNRVETSPTPTGWQASRVLETGLADQVFADVESIEG